MQGEVKEYAPLKNGRIGLSAGFRETRERRIGRGKTRMSADRIFLPFSASHIFLPGQGAKHVGPGYTVTAVTLLNAGLRAQRDGPSPRLAFALLPTGAA